MYIDAMKSCLFQAFENSLGSAIKKAKQVLDPSTNGDVITADELASAADELHETIESVVSAGLAKSHPLVVEATELDKSLRDEGSKLRVGELYVASMLECTRKRTCYFVEKCINLFAR